MLSTIARLLAEVHTWDAVPRVSMDERAVVRPTQEEIDDESHLLRRLRVVVQLTPETIAGGDLSAEDASRMIAETRNLALTMFPGKENAFDLLYRPKFQRMMRAVYRLQ